jgi:hypothetical protein
MSSNWRFAPIDTITAYRYLPALPIYDLPINSMLNSFWLEQAIEGTGVINTSLQIMPGSQ